MHVQVYMYMYYYICTVYITACTRVAHVAHAHAYILQGVCLEGWTAELEQQLEAVWTHL